jgi:hypothetical protein
MTVEVRPDGTLVVVCRTDVGPKEFRLLRAKIEIIAMFPGKDARRTWPRYAAIPATIASSSKTRSVGARRTCRPRWPPFM